MRWILVLLLAGCGAPLQQPQPQPQPQPAPYTPPAPAPIDRSHVFAPPPQRIDVGPRRSTRRSRPRPAALPKGQVISIEASWYGERYHGRKTASGERFDMYGMTAAHKSLPFGTRVQVIHPATGKTVEVRINDRCGRAGEIDLAKGAAEALGIIRAGRLQVDMVILP